jgi:hypothetical protein
LRDVVSDWTVWGLVLLVGFSVYLRFWALDHFPGVNGDESWIAVQLHAWQQGASFPWKTPTHRLLTPTYTLLALLFQALSKSSVWMLRFPAAVSGALTAVLAYPLLRRAMPRAQAQIASVWIACLSLHIAYSRIGWEPSQIPLLALLVVYSTLSRSRALTAGFFVFALLVHTINVFLLPIAAAPFFYELWRDGKLPKKRWLAAIGFLSGEAAVYLLNSIPHPELIHFVQWNELPSLVVGYSRIFSGILAFVGFSAELPSKISTVIDTVSILGLVGLVSWRLRSLSGFHRAFAGGIAFSIFCFFLVAGTMPISTGHERYCLWLGIPSLILFALLWPPGAWFQALAYGLAAAMLAGTVAFYFLPMQRSGGSATRAYHAGSPDPKVAAAEWIQRDARGPAVTIVADEWWLYWVLLEFVPTPQVHSSLIYYSDLTRPPQKTLLSTMMLDGGYAVGFSGGEVEKSINDLRKDGWTFREQSLLDSASLPFVKVWKLRRLH